MDGELRRRYRRMGFWVGLGALAFGLVIVLQLDQAGPDGNRTRPPRESRLVLAGTYEYWSAPTIVADRLRLFDEVELEVREAKFQSGIQAKNAVLNGTADVGVVATTPMAIGAFQDEDLVLIATMVQDGRLVKLVGRNPSRPVSPEDIVGGRVGYVPGTISEITLHRLIDEYDIDEQDFTTATYRPPDLVRALGRGEIDSFVAWEPIPLLAARDVEGASAFVDPDLYRVSLHIVTRPDVLRDRQPALTAFLRALQMANDAIKRDPDQARTIVESALDFDPGELESVWGDLQFMVDLDVPQLINDLETEGQWALDSGYVRGDLPDYSKVVDASVVQTLLESVE